MELTTEMIIESLIPIHNNWYPLFLKHIKLLHQCLLSIHEHTHIAELSPPLNDVFNAFIIDPNFIKVIIIGQDPYPNKGNAHGFSFSSKSENTPQSLKNIFLCLNRLGYNTDSNNLINWVLQGTFLLNMALTTEIEHTNKHTTYWWPFISNIISELTSLHNNLNILLWGKIAQTVTPFIKGVQNIKIWSHPSPLADTRLDTAKKFINCDNFDNLLHMDWSTTNSIDIYTDGSGAPKSDCWFAIYSSSLMKISDEVIPYIYTLSDTDKQITVVKKMDKPATAQRAEYLAIAYALLICYKLDLCNVNIITDSRNAYGILVEWEKRKEETYENCDIVHIMRTIYKKWLCDNNVKIIHTFSHNKTKSKYNEGNNIADKLASSHVYRLESNIKLGIKLNLIKE